ncbi:helix-turn-helix domain-containing protein [Myxococcota bacterium]|nr:helix-turn-helix domain-containing protein [Myxococcota bacterium]
MARGRSTVLVPVTPEDLDDARAARARDLLADGTLSIDDAAVFSGLGRSTLYELMDSGALAFVQIPGVRRRLIPRRALIDLAASGLRGSTI